MSDIKKDLATARNETEGTRMKWHVAVAAGVLVSLALACFTLCACSSETQNESTDQTGIQASEQSEQQASEVNAEYAVEPDLAVQPAGLSIEPDEDAEESQERMTNLNNNQWTKENETLIAAQLSCAKKKAEQNATDALAKAQADKRAQQAAMSRDDVSYAQMYTTTTNAPAQPATQSAQVPVQAAQAPDTINVLGAVIPFVDAYDVTRAPEHGAGVWRGDESTTDGGMCYFVGHNPGDFHNVMNLQNGDVVTVCDTAGAVRSYTVHDNFIVAQKSTYNAIQSRVEGHGESIVMQTCCGDGLNVRIVVAW